MSLRLIKKRNTKKKKDDIVRFFVDEVKYSPVVGKKEGKRDRIILYLLPLIAVVSVLCASLSWCDLSVNMFALAVVTVILHTLIHHVVYTFSAKGKKTGISVMIIGYVAVVIVLKNILKEGILYVVDDYLQILNSYKGTDYTLEYHLTYNRELVIFVLLVVIMAFLLFLFNYIAVCYTSRTLFMLFSAPWLVLPFAAGIRPSQPHFLIYVATLIVVWSTKSFPKKRVNPSRKNASGSYKRFVDSPVCKMMYSVVVICITAFIVASISIPKKFHNEEYLINRHEETEYKVKTKIKEMEDKYEIKSDTIDRMLGIDDLKIGDVQETVEKIHEKKDEDEIWKKIADIVKPDNKLINEIENKYINGGKSFFNGYIHGNLVDTIDKSNLNTEKIYVFSFEDTGYDMESVYLKNYNSVEYSEGKWIDKNVLPNKKLDVDFEKLFYEKFVLNNNLDSLDDSSDDSFGSRKIKISQTTQDSSDNITKYIMADDVIPSKENNKLSVEYSMPNNNPLLGIESPGKVEKYFNYLKNSDWWYYDGANSYYIGSFVWYLYDKYVEVPDEVEEIAEFARNGFEFNGKKKDYIDKCVAKMKENTEVYQFEYDGYVEESLSMYDDYYNIDSYNEYAVAAINYVQNVLSSGYTYTLSPKKTDGTDPVCDFMFNTHEGYCMHFASAATIMLRGLGVPARYVEGYMLDGESLNDAIKSGTEEIDGKNMASVGIYGTNAHAWVEVFLDELGWTPIEMTLGDTKEGETFYDVSNEYRIVQEEIKQQKEEKEEKEQHEDENTKDNKEKDLDNQGAENEKHNNGFILAVKKAMPIVVPVFMVAAFVYVVTGIIKKRRKARLKKLRTTKGAYRFITKKLLKAADKAGVKVDGSNHYLDMAEVFAGKDEYMNAEDAKMFMAVLRHATYSKEGVTVEDVDCLKNIYNRYMSGACSDRNSLSAFLHEKILGEVMSV